MLCATTVAAAAPRMPILKLVMKIISNTMFSIDEITRNKRGIVLSPIAYKSPAQILYVKVTIKKAVKIDIYEYAVFIMDSGMLINFSNGIIKILAVTEIKNVNRIPTTIAPATVRLNRS